MTFSVRIASTDYSFPCKADEAILDAAQRAGLELPYSCKKGICGNCRGRIVSGESEMVGATQGLSATERGVGFVLYCRAQPRSDLVIQPVEVKRAEPGARRRVRARILSLSDACPDVTIMHLRFPAGVRAKFRAGQYLHVIFGDDERRSFSLANTPAESDGAVLHIRRVPHGRFTGEILPSLAPGQTLTVELPYGDFYLREDSTKPIVLVASGTGFAPIQSIVEHTLAKDIQRPMVLYWGVRDTTGLYAQSRIEAWLRRRDDLRFVPVLSAPRPEDAWTGRTGLVHQAVMQDYPSLEEFQTYVCGSPAMTRSAREDFTTQRHLPEHEFYSDAFVPGPAVK
jgi:NAD(P)H-flavin reductase/ferredoxin